MVLAVPYLSVIVPIAIYHVLQDIASVEGGRQLAITTMRAASWRGTQWERYLRRGGSIVLRSIYALHPPYKAMGARDRFCVWTPVIFLAVVVSGLAISLWPDCFPGRSWRR